MSLPLRERYIYISYIREPIVGPSVGGIWISHSAHASSRNAISSLFFSSRCTDAPTISHPPMGPLSGNSWPKSRKSTEYANNLLVSPDLCAVDLIVPINLFFLYESANSCSEIWINDDNRNDIESNANFEPQALISVWVWGLIHDWTARARGFSEKGSYRIMRRRGNVTMKPV